MRSLVTDETPGATPVAALCRLWCFPAIVGILFMGGVFWLRVHLDVAGGTPEQTSFVQVHLMPRPDPVPIPVEQSPQTAALAPPSPANGPTETPTTVSNQALAALPADEPAASEPEVPSAGLKAMPDPALNSARMTFRTELLRHIARFQRYPRAGRPQHLQGAVDTEFSIDREGKLIGVWVKTSSGHPELDQAAIDTIRRAQPLPSIPAGMPDSIKVDIVLGFDPS